MFNWRLLRIWYFSFVRAVSIFRKMTCLRNCSEHDVWILFAILVGCLKGRKMHCTRLMMFSDPSKEKKPFFSIAWQLALYQNFFSRRKVKDGRVRARLESQAVQRQIILRVEDHPITVQVTQASFVFISLPSTFLLWESRGKSRKILSLLHSSSSLFSYSFNAFLFCRNHERLSEWSLNKNLTGGLSAL